MSEPLEVLQLTDEPIVGKRRKPALAKIGCEDDLRSVVARAAKAPHQAVEFKTGAGHESNA